MIIESQVQVEVKINGVEVPLGPTTLLGLSKIQSTTQLLPALDLEFIDHDRLFSSAILTDGAPISVLMNPQLGDAPSTPDTFRLFNILELKPTPLGHKVHLSGYLDKPRMFREVVQEAIKGPSSKVISSLGSKLGLSLDVDSTGDTMAWLPNNKTIGQFMRHAMDHSFAGAGAAMQLAVTSAGNGNWVLRFKDALKQLSAGSVATMISESLTMDITGTKTIEDYVYRFHGGTLNSSTGYSSSVVQTSIEGVMDIFKDVSFLSSLTSIGMSSEVKGLFGGGVTRREIFQPDLGNTHKKFAEAKNINQRVKATLSEHLHVMTRSYMPVMLLDPITTQIASGYENELDPLLSNKWIILGRTQYVRGQFYRERLHLSNQGTSGGGS